jgi:NADPH-dependent 2,4-dienoyl-CoA reductase/sulfur reductase-like enzyme/rhodanese-related sulfurtransferase
MSKNILVIGAVACGTKAAARARRLDPEAQITIIEQGEFISYAGCGMPYFLSRDVTDFRQLMQTPLGVIRDSLFFKASKNIDVKIHTRAESIDREGRVVRAVNVLSGERHDLSYDYLVIATGATPLVPPIDGVDLKGVYTLGSMEDAIFIDAALNRGNVKKAAVVGGGLIGLEAGEALSRRGCGLTVIEKLDRPAAQLFDLEMGVFLEKHLREKGVSVVTSATVTKLVGDGDGNVRSVSTDRGEFDAEIVIVAAGVKPNDELARACGLETHERGGIIVDGTMRTSDPFIYAGGDCVVQRDLVSGGMAYVPLGSTANRHGRVIANAIMGIEDRFEGVARATVFKVFDYAAGKTGLTEDDCRKTGIDCVTAVSTSPDKAHFFPGAAPLVTKLVADRKTRRILGAQIIGPGNASRRIDIATSLLTFGATVDQLANLDVAYAPPFSPALDAITTAANVLRNRLDGTAWALSYRQLKDKLDRGDDFVILDVRLPVEIEIQGRFPGDNLLNIPLGEVRSRLSEIPRDKEIITLCKVGLRAYEAERILNGAGFAGVQFLDGGITMWPYDMKTSR